MKILVSACLLGENYKYNGKNNYNNLVVSLAKDFEIFPICPEVFGGLSVPRLPSEILNDKVINDSDIDLTLEFKNGAYKALQIALDNDIKYAILKEKSPSCGVRQIYDGTFSGNLIVGKGITTRLLEEHGIKCFSELEIDLFLNFIKNDLSKF